MKKKLDDDRMGIAENSVRTSEFTVEIQPARRYVKYDALVLDAQLRQSLVTVRSLGCHGKNIAALEISSLIKEAKRAPAFSSRWA